MRWFTDDANAGEDTDWDEILAAYSAHLAEVAPQVPPSLAALATDQQHHLARRPVDPDLPEAAVAEAIGAEFRATTVGSLGVLPFAS